MDKATAYSIASEMFSSLELAFTGLAFIFVTMELDASSKGTHGILMSVLCMISSGLLLVSTMLARHFYRLWQQTPKENPDDL